MNRRAELARLDASCETLPSSDALARRSAVLLEIGELEKNIQLFERLRTSNEPLLPIQSLQGLPDILIAARIARGMTQKDLAQYLGMKMQQIQQYEAERYQSVSLRRLTMIADALCVSVHQQGEIVGDRTLESIDTSKVSCFPVGEMYRRGWLGLCEGSPIKALDEARWHVPNFFRQAYGGDSKPRRRYVRASGIPHEAAILAWEARIMILADAQPLPVTFCPALADAGWIRTLVQLSAGRNSMKRIKGHLRDIGIRLAAEPALPGMQIDGAALRTPNGVAVVALTLRDYRLESFWLTLMHELAHLILHIGTHRYDAIFDELSAPPGSNLEDEADIFARESIIPFEKWKYCKSQYKPTRDAIYEDARRLGVGVPVVLGLIRQHVGEAQMPRGLIAERDVRRLLFD